MNPYMASTHSRVSQLAHLLLQTHLFICWNQFLLFGLLITGLFYPARPALAQSSRSFTSNRLLWTEGSIEGRIKDKWFYDLDFQYRRQADASDSPTGDYWAIVKYPSEMVLRPFLTYKPNSSLSLSLSPIGWYGRWIIGPNYPLSLTPELRLIPQIAYSVKLNQVKLEQRGRYEFRRVGERHPVSGGGDIDEGYVLKATWPRVWYRLRASLPLSGPHRRSQWAAVSYDEVVLDVGLHRPAGSALDQNLAFAGLECVLPGDILIEVGYLHQVILRLTPNMPDDIRLNQVLSLTLQVNDLSHFFKRR